MASLRRAVDRLLSIGAYAGEPETQRARRRIMIAAIWLASVATLPTIASDFAQGYFWSAMGSVVVLLVTTGVLVALSIRPSRFAALIIVLLATDFVVQLVQTTLFEGLLASGGIVLYDLIAVFAALFALGIRAAAWWFGGFVVSVVYAVAIPDLVDPLYKRADPDVDAAFTVVATGIVTFALMIYFVRQRDRFQRRSDDLLHNILPEEIADRLKGSSAMIADSFESAAVLFADVVDFTPMSASMSPEQLVTLLDTVFTTFDGFVRELGLEKIKTVGDAYMVASGVPVPRPDHAEAIAELALRMRDHATSNELGGRPIRLRIGVSSGPVVAGIIGSHKFAYDLWGDAVNTASRMESAGVPGAIQMTSATYELIKDRFVWEPRGTVPVKGKGEMEAYLLVSRRPE